jgi:transaldolase
MTTLKTQPIQQLAQHGQTLWLDNLSRALITSGELIQLRDAGITGITSNPTIFAKAISGSIDYSADLVRLSREGRRPEEVVWDLMIEDVQAAADIFRPVYDASIGANGFVSIEVGPAIADDTESTISMARELHHRCDRANVMVKIPATAAGLPAIRQMISEGRNTNVTLIFSVDRYSEVVEAYLSGLEELQKRGGDLSRVASVASFFVSRVDSKIDGLLRQAAQSTRDQDHRRDLEALYGRAGIANSKLAYQRFRDLFAGERWQALEAAGARVQRCLWASTSVKDSRYGDTMYVEALIGPDTIDTVPPATLAAFREHGHVRPGLTENIDEARRDLHRLRELGINLEQVTDELEVEGVRAFVESYDSLVSAISHAVRC